MAFGDLQFAEDDARVLADKLRELYEAIRRANGESGFRLSLAAPERLVQLTEAAVLAQVNHDIDRTGKGNLLFFAGSDTIEYLGDLYGDRGKRLQASYAMTTMRYTLSIVRASATPIPKGSRATADNQLFFATTKPAEIPPGQLYVDIEAQCNVAGTAGMGFEAGAINNMVDIIPFVASAENITPTSGGMDIEDIESYRARLRTVPESFSVAGPDGAYEFWARTANPGIVDARAWMPALDLVQFAAFLAPWGITDAAGFYRALGDYYRESGTGPGNVDVTVLMQDGELPSGEVLSQVEEILSNRTRRPLTDYVHVVQPEAVGFNVALRYWIETERATEAVSIIDSVNSAVERYIAWQKSRLGLDIIPDRLHKLIMDCGVKRVEITEPAFAVLKPHEVAQFSGIKTITYEGLEDA